MTLVLEFQGDQVLCEGGRITRTGRGTVNQLVSIVEAKFTATVTHSGEDILLEMTGNADVAAKQHLAPLLRGLHEHAKQLGVSRVQVDIRRLAFMNSSCLKDLIGWLDRARAEGTSNYRIAFLSSVNQHWQKRSLHALSSLRARSRDRGSELDRCPRKRRPTPPPRRFARRRS